MDRTAHDELTAREAEAWASFEAAVDAVPRQLRSAPSLSDGWSVKDLLWHVAFWWNEGAAGFERIHLGSEESGETGDTDETNAAALEASRAMTLDEVEAEMVRIRGRMLRAWAEVLSDDAAETFVSETVEHYDEHRPALQALNAS